MNELDRIWDNGWGKTLVHLAEMKETIRRVTRTVTQMEESCCAIPAGTDGQCQECRIRPEGLYVTRRGRRALRWVCPKCA